MLIRRGIIKTKAEREREAKEKAKPKYYNVWSLQEEQEKSRSQIAREKMAFPAPKLPLPGHAERYFSTNVSTICETRHLVIDRLLSSSSTKVNNWLGRPKIQKTGNNLGCLNTFLTCEQCRPTRISIKVRMSASAIFNFLAERFERCLDLYLAPRQRKMKMNVRKEDLIPKLPSPKDLQPFPTFQVEFVNVFCFYQQSIGSYIQRSRGHGPIYICSSFWTIFGLVWRRWNCSSMGDHFWTLS